MLAERVDLYGYFGITRPEGGEGYLNCYIPEKSCYEGRIRPAMLVIAGGGYGYVSPREKECIAFTYLAKSFCAFTLDYSIGPKVIYPAQLTEGCMAMAYIRENAEKLGVDASHVAAIGFSAGGHLAAMLGNVWNEKEAASALKDKISLCRPDAVVLSYPVITAGEKAHKGSFEYLCGGDFTLADRLSMEKRVTENSSPAFIWATADDGAVPSENSLLLAAAYKKCGVPFELHIFESGRHGLSLANEETGGVNEPVRKWVELSVTWLKNRGFGV